MMRKIKLLVERNKIVAEICRFVYRRTILKFKHRSQNKNFLEKGEIVLDKIHAIFTELNIQYWLEYGTLLGAVRDKSFISNDLDIDLGLFLKDYSEDIEEVFLAKGFKKLRKITIDEGEYGMEESYIYDGVVVDLFYFISDNKEIYSHSFINEKGLSWTKTIEERGGLVVRELFFPHKGFRKIKFLNGEYPIPRDVSNHLKAYYGEDFMVKNSNWNIYMAKNVEILKDKIGVVHSYE